ncbi:MAG: restriction endonuclease subunit S, partial [Candidatus Krumholzibacteria bacterium]
MTPDRLLDHFDRISDAPDAMPRLRRLILVLAVRGKLVKQDPNDEPASKLLKRIQAEKARLVKERKIRKQEPTLLVEIGDQPFELPTNWEWARFGGIADFSAGRTPSRHDFSYWNTGDYPWVSIADMTDGGVVITTKETVSEKAKDHLFHSEPAPVGTLIMSFKLTIGKISRLGVPAFHNEAIISIHPHLAAMDAYLFKVLPRISQQGDTKDAIKGATLNRESITNLFLPLPPLAEQHRIVAKVDELMALCNRLEAAQAERESRRDRLAAASLHRLNNGADAESFREHARFHFGHLLRLTTRPEHIQQLRQT